MQNSELNIIFAEVLNGENNSVKLNSITVEL